MPLRAGAETSYEWAEALAFVDECEARPRRILGLDLMLVDERGHTPMTSTNWADLDERPIEDSWSAARELLADGIPDGATHVIFATCD
jgi:hypothetical protein